MATHYTYPISWCTKKELWMVLGSFCFFWIAIYFVFLKFTDSNTPVLDSLVSASAITAMWWMARRKIENWLAWIFSNIVAIPLNFYKGLMLFTLMYVLFLAMAWWGFVNGKKRRQLYYSRRPCLQSTSLTHFNLLVAASFPAITGNVTCNTPSTYFAVMLVVSMLSFSVKLLSNPPRLYSLMIHRVSGNLPAGCR